MGAGRVRADPPDMRPLAPAAFELRCTGAGLLACGALVALVALPGAGRSDLEAAALGLAVALLALWGLWGAQATRRAIRLALPVAGRWAFEATPRTLVRVAGLQVLPAAAVAAAAALAAGGRLEAAPAAAAGALCGAGLTALLCAARVRRAERSRGRRLLREPRRGLPLARRAFYLEPEVLAPRPSGRPPAPWPAHRPPPRPQEAAIELEPANGPARHASGVRYPRRPGAPAQGWESR
jgi:hypothetical protein